MDDPHAAPANESLELVAQRDGRGIGTLRIGRAGAAQQVDPGVVATRDLQLLQANGAIGEVALDGVRQSLVNLAAAEVGELIGGWMGVGREGCQRHIWEPQPDGKIFVVRRREAWPNHEVDRAYSSNQPVQRPRRGTSSRSARRPRGRLASVQDPRWAFEREALTSLTIWT